MISFEVSYNIAVSRGHVKLNPDDPTDPLAPPEFNGPYLNNASDAAPLIWASRFLRNLTRSFPHPVLELVPGAHVQTNEDLRHYIECGLPQFRPEGLEDCDPSPMIVNHLCGTARMAPAPQSGTDLTSGVVDGELRVHGVQRLRVGDASIFPTLPSGNSHASCMVILPSVHTS